MGMQNLQTVQQDVQAIIAGLKHGSLLSVDQQGHFAVVGWLGRIIRAIKGIFGGQGFDDCRLKQVLPQIDQFCKQKFFEIELDDIAKLEAVLLNLKGRVKPSDVPAIEECLKALKGEGVEEQPIQEINSADIQQNMDTLDQKPLK